MSKSSRRRFPRTTVLVLGLLAFAVVSAMLHSGLGSMVGIWGAIIVGVRALMKRSPKSVGGYSHNADEDDSDDSSSYHRRRREPSAWEREEAWMQDGFDAEQQRHQDEGRV